MPTIMHNTDMDGPQVVERTEKTFGTTGTDLPSEANEPGPVDFDELQAPLVPVSSPDGGADDGRDGRADRCLHQGRPGEVWYLFFRQVGSHSILKEMSYTYARSAVRSFRSVL